jgi:hypothetical protein
MGSRMKIVKARKRHMCDHCHEWIEPGDEYWYDEGIDSECKIYTGSPFWAIKFCAECQMCFDMGMSHEKGI